MILTCLLVFISGFLFESGCVFWVHFTERNKIVKATLVSMFCATCQIAGIGESLHDLRTAPFFILGFGGGTFVSIIIKNKLKK
jgi:hypothetical protein